MKSGVEGEATELAKAAWAAASRQDWQAAEALWRRCVDSGRPIPSWYGGFASALRRLGRHAEADAVCERAWEIWPDEPIGWVGRAQGAAARKDWNTAEALWRACLARFGDAAKAGWWASLGDALRQQSRLVEAQEVYRIAQLRFPAESAGWEGEARIASARGVWRHAAKAWETAAEKIGAAPKCVENAFGAWLRSGRFADASRVVKQIKDQDIDSGRWIAAGLELFAAQGDWRGAIGWIGEHASHSRFDQLVSAEHVCRAAFEAGLSPAEAVELLARSLPGSNAGRAIDTAYSKARSDSQEEIAKATDFLVERSKQVAGVGRKSKLCRGLARAFLKNRTYARFSALAEAAIPITSDRRVRLLRTIAARHFPASPMRLKLERFLGEELHCRDVAFATGWRRALPQPGNGIADRLKELSPRRLLCATIVRDEAEMLPRFVAHHVGLGVKHFLVIDNGSVDGLGGIRRGFPGAEVVVVDAPFSYARNRHGMTWINEILDAGVCDWLLLADADERLVFPGCDALGIDALLDHFERRGENVMPAFMLDLYDRDYMHGRAPSDDFQAHSLFYAMHSIEPSLDAPYFNVTGGCRMAGYLSAPLSKTPLLRACTGVRMVDPHHVNACKPSATTGVLLHYKIFRDRGLLNRTVETIVADSRVKDRSTMEIARHIEFANRSTNERPAGPFHLTYSGLPQLTALGYAFADAQWRGIVSEHMRDRSSGVVRDGAPGRRPDFAAKSRSCEQLDFSQLLSQVETLALAQQRHALGILLRANLPRIGMRTVKLGLFVLAASLLGRDARARRLTRAMVSALRVDGDEAAGHLLPILEKLAAHAPQAALAVLDAMIETTVPTPALWHLRARIFTTIGEWHKSADILSRIDYDDKSSDHALRLAVFRRVLCWPEHGKALRDRVADARQSPDIWTLSQIHTNPDPHLREELLQAICGRLQPRMAELRSNEAAIFLAALHGLKLEAKLRGAFAGLRDRLSPDARMYFERLIDADGIGARKEQTIWCLGLSRTGTTSLHEQLGRLGLLSAHWTNPITGNLLGAEDAEIFDAVGDISIVHHAMQHGVDPSRNIIVTTRDFDTWEKSFLAHCASVFAQRFSTYDALRESFYGRALSAHPYGSQWFDLHHELYFRHAALRMAYESHRDWIASLAARTSRPPLILPVEAGDKAERLAEYFGVTGAVFEYPHANERV